jgi:hypothetical protein
VFAYTVDGLPPGRYHVTMAPFSLRWLDDGTGTAPDPDLFPDTTERSPFPPRAIVVLTSVFDRNMYRYREPRTFRTVHMDVGHLAGTIAVLAKAEGVRAGFFMSDDAERIEQALELDGMDEGYLMSIALADGSLR